LRRGLWAASGIALALIGLSGLAILKGPDLMRHGTERTPEAAQEQERNLPVFDAIKIEPDGAVTLFGYAPATAAIAEILDGDQVVGQAPVGQRGAWALPLPPAGRTGVRQLRMQAVRADGSKSTLADLVILTPADPSREGRKPDGASAIMALHLPGEGGGRVLQAPRQAAILNKDDTHIMAIDYNRGGKVTFFGTGAPGHEAWLYWQGQLIGHTPIGAHGEWSLTPSRGLDNGRHGIRVDQVNAVGKVTSRAEVSFDKKPLPDPAPTHKAATVLPGQGLWALSRRHSGDDPLYTIIYDPAQNQARDPQSVRPGQIFVLPTPSGQPSR
jgi:hypothetical protein